MWGVNISGVGKNTKAQWTKRPIPDELVTFKSRSYEPDITVNFGLMARCASSGSRGSQAESADEGKTWQISRTELANNPPETAPMSGVQQ
jgi:hypothetical protein